MLKSLCESSLPEDIGQCYFLLLQVYRLSSSIIERSIFSSSRNLSRYPNVQEDYGASPVRNVFISMCFWLQFTAASQELIKENGNVQYCFEHKWNISKDRIHGLDHDLMQLLKTSERNMVMYNIVSNLIGIFRRISKATEWKIDCKKPSG